MVTASQDRLFPAPPAAAETLANTTVFTPNMTLPVHRWFRYSAGFSAAWVEQVVKARTASHGSPEVLDPFAGSGTTLIASQIAGARSTGIESHPLVAQIAKAKLEWGSSADEFERRAGRILASTSPLDWSSPPALLEKIYPSDTLAALLGLRETLRRSDTGDPADALLWLALLAILRPCSPVGTAQWQYVLPNKTKAKVADPLSAFAAQVRAMASDMRDMPLDAPEACLLQEDARLAPSVSPASIDLVITSPPYPNNYDYADATRIELTFLGEIERWSDLQSQIRVHLIRSCSQHMVRYDADEALLAPELEPIRAELSEVYLALSESRQHHGGKKAYHSMVAAYFHDLARVWVALRRVCRPRAQVLFVVGDSAPYGVYVPVDRWLGELALSAGFESYSFSKLRDRNTKWKNRKHRVPLHEGLLTVEG